ALAQPGRQLAVDLVQDRFRQEAAGDARLVGDDDDSEPRPVERADGVDRPGKERDARARIEVADVLDHRAVAIEKNSGIQRACRAAPTTAATPMRRMPR